MAHYKLTYFDIRGRAEIARLIFAAAGVDYEDFRIARDKWPELKPSTPFGQIPLLEVDGIVLCQSKTIARYLARKFNLAGETELDQARADMIVDCIQDAIEPTIIFRRLAEGAAKVEMKTKYVGEQLPVSLLALEKLLKENNGGDGYFVGEKLTWVDLALIDTVHWLQAIVEAGDDVAKYPKLHALQQRVENIPAIAEYLAKRPKRDF